MSIDNKQFDDFLNAKFAERQFEQKAEYWEKAKAMLPSKSNIFFTNELITLSVSLLLITGLTLGMWSTNSSLHADNTITQIPTFATSVENFSVEKTTFNQAETTALNSENNSTDNKQPKLSNNSEVIPVSNNANDKQPKRPAKSARKAQKEYIETKSAEAADFGLVKYPDVALTELSGNTVATNKLTLPVSGLKQPSSVIERKLTGINKYRSYLAGEMGANFYGNNLAWGYHAAIKYHAFLNTCLGISAGIGLSQLATQIPTRTIHDIDYTFGKIDNSLNIATQSIQYIELPVQLHYKISGNHFLTATAQAAYALQTNNQIWYNNNAAEKKLATGYRNGINQFDYQIGLGYTYHFNRFYLNGQYLLGMSDVLNNSGIYRNNGIRITFGIKVY
jgi:hypothetical protein